MSATAVSSPLIQLATSTAVVAGGKLFIYKAGTTTKQTTWTDSTQATPNANPLIFDSNGVGVIWADPTIPIKFVFAPANDTDPPSSPLYTQDNVSPPVTGATVTAFQIYPQTTAEAAAGIVPSNFTIPGIAQWAYISRFGGNLVSAIAVAAQQLVLGQNYTIIVDQAVALAASATVTATTGLQFLASGIITVASGKVLTLNGPVVGPFSQATHLAGSGTVAFGSSRIDFANKFTLYGQAWTQTVQIVGPGTSMTLDASVSNAQWVTLTANVGTFVTTNFGEGQAVNLYVIQDTTGSRTLASSSGMKWAGGTAPTLSTAANAVDLLTIHQINGTKYAAFTKGFA